MREGLGGAVAGKSGDPSGAPVLLLIPATPARGGQGRGEVAGGGGGVTARVVLLTQAGGGRD